MRRPSFEALKAVGAFLAITSMPGAAKAEKNLSPDVKITAQAPSSVAEKVVNTLETAVTEQKVNAEKTPGLNPHHLKTLPKDILPGIKKNFELTKINEARSLALRLSVVPNLKSPEGYVGLEANF